MVRPRLMKASRRSFPLAALHTARSRLQQSSVKIDVDKLLEKPAWSVDTLVPSATTSSSSPPISSKQLHHLLRLSALPPPKDAQDEARMLATLSSQLHFVNQIRNVDTTGVRPLQSLRDETTAAIDEAEIDLRLLSAHFNTEDLRGNYYKRIRKEHEPPVKGEDLRHVETSDPNPSYTWDVLGNAPKKLGRYFVVDGGKKA